MQVFITAIIIFAQGAGVAPTEQTFSYIDQMPEVLITAQRYEHEDDAWSGIMDTIVVEAPRYIRGAANSWIIPSITQNRFSIYVLSVGILSLMIGLFISYHHLHKHPKSAKQTCNCRRIIIVRVCKQKLK